MATDILTLGIAVKSDDVVTASDRLNKLESQAGSTEQSASKLGGTFDKLGYSTQSLVKYIEAAAAALALMELAKKASEAALLAARYETLGVVMKVVGNNAGYTSGQMEEFQKGLQKTGISAIEARQGLVLMGEAHVDMAKSAQLARVAQDAAVIANTNSSEAFNRMMTGISTGQAIILHHMGLMVNFEKSYKDLADTLGKSKEELTEVEKTTARVNEVMRVSTGISGSYEAAMSTAGKAMNSLKRYTDDLKVALGEAFTPALKVVVDELTRSLQEMNQTMKDNRSATQSFGEMLGNFVSGSLNYFKKDLIQISALLADMKSGMLLLGSFVTFGDNSRGLKADADAMSKFAASQREYLAAMRAADNGQSALDPSDQMKLKVAKSQAEQARIDLGNKGRSEEVAAEAKAAAEKAAEEAAEESRRQEAAHAHYLQSLEHVRESARKVNDAYDKLHLSDMQNATAQQETILKSRYDQGLIDEQTYLDKKYQLDKAASDKEISQLNEAAVRAQKAFEAADNAPEYHKGDSSTPTDAAAITRRNTALEEYIKAWEKLQGVKAKGAQLDVKYNADAITSLDKQIAAVEKLRTDLGTIQDATKAMAAAQVGISPATGKIDTIADQTAHDLAVQQAAHEALMRQYDEQIAAVEALRDAKNISYEEQAEYDKKIIELEKQKALSEQDNSYKTAKIQHDSVNSQLSMYADYAQGAATLLTSLADAQDQSSRKGFETAKAFNLAAAVMSTAAGIMNQYSSGDPYTANFRALIVAATGVVQIAKIASTTFKGGSASVTAPAGSFNAGSSQSSLGSNSGIGSQIGTQYSSVYDQQSQESLQNLAKSADNASLAIGKVADGLTKIPDLFTTGSYLTLATNGLSSADISKSSKGLMDYIKDNLSAVLNPFKTLGGLLSGKLDVSNLKAAMQTADPIGAYIMNGIFGGSWQTEAAGLALQLQNGRVDAYNYVKQTKDGGWFRSNKTRYKYTANSEWSDIIQTSVDSISSTILHGAVAMGTTANLASAVVKRTNIQTTGRTDQQISDDLQTWLTNASNELAKTVVGLKEYTFYNENAYDALVRLSTALQDTNEKFELIGSTLIGSTLAGANSAYKLQQLFGGTEAFDKAISTYFTAMFTDSEQYGMKAAQAVRQVNTAFGEMDISVPATRAEFSKLVNSLDTSTESGAALFAALMNISTAFGTVQDQIDAQTSQTQDLTTRLLTAMGYSTESDLYALKIQQQKELTEATQKGLDVTALAIVQQVEYAAALMKPIKTMSTALHDMIDSAVTYTTKQAFAIVSTALTSGNLSNTTQLTAAAKVLNGLSSDGYSTALDYQRGQALANAMITNLAAMADNQISDAEKTYMVSVSQLNALTDITTEIQGLRNEVRAVATATGKALTIFDKWDGDGMPSVAA